MPQHGCWLVGLSIALLFVVNLGGFVLVIQVSVSHAVHAWPADAFAADGSFQDAVCSAQVDTCGPPFVRFILASVRQQQYQKAQR